jgi:hypothetical protein
MPMKGGLMDEKRDDRAVPKLTTGTTDEKLVRIDQRLVIIDKRLEEMERDSFGTTDEKPVRIDQRLVIIDKRLEEMERDSLNSLGLALSIAGAGLFFSGISLQNTNVILVGLFISLLGVAIGVWRVVRQYRQYIEKKKECTPLKPQPRH